MHTKGGTGMMSPRVVTKGGGPSLAYRPPLSPHSLVQRFLHRSTSKQQLGFTCWSACAVWPQQSCPLCRHFSNTPNGRNGTERRGSSIRQLFVSLRKHWPPT